MILKDELSLLGTCTSLVPRPCHSFVASMMGLGNEARVAPATSGAVELRELDMKGLVKQVTLYL